MAYLGAVNIGEKGGTGEGVNRKDLFLNYRLQVLEAFTRKCIAIGLISNQVIPYGKAAAHIVGQFADGTDHSTHTAGTQISVTDQAFDERLIAINDIEYVAKRVDSFEEKMADYASSMVITNYMGETMAKYMDEHIFTKIEAAASATGLVGNPDGGTITNTVIASASTPSAIGDAIADSVFDATAQLQIKDGSNDAVVVVDPINYGYLVRSERMVNADYTGGNGGLDTGRINMINGAKVYVSNSLPTTASLEALVFTSEAVGITILQGLKSESNYQPDFFGDLMTTRVGFGCNTLRPECAMKIVSA